MVRAKNIESLEKLALIQDISYFYVISMLKYIQRMSKWEEFNIPADTILV